MTAPGRVVFMCGPAGSGKSTIAREYEQRGMVRLSIDAEARDRGLARMPLSDEVAAEIEAVLRRRLVELVRAGIDVVVDFSFASRRMRDDYRRLLRPLGVTPGTVYLATARSVALDRVRARSVARGGDDFPLDEETAARYFDSFEVPTEEEGPLTVVSTPPS